MTSREVERVHHVKVGGTQVRAGKKPPRKDAVAEVWQLLYRYRVELAPFGLAVIAIALQRVAETTGLVLTLDLAYLGLVGAVVVFGQYLRIGPDRHKVYAVVCLGVLVVWSWWTSRSGLDPMHGLVLFPVASVLAVPWWRYRRIRSKVEVRTDGLTKADRLRAIKRATSISQKWNAIALAAKVPGARLRRVHQDGWFVSVYVTLPMGCSEKSIKLDKLASALGAGLSMVRVVPDKKDARKITIHVRLKDPHEKPIVYKGASMRTAKDLIELGVSEHGRTVTMPLRHALFAGASESGKSGGMNVLADNCASAEDVALIGIDLKFGLELGPWGPVMALPPARNVSGTDPLTGEELNAAELAVLLLKCCVQAIAVRSELMAKWGVRQWPSSPDRPELALLIDEVAILKSHPQGDRWLRQVMTQARAVGIRVILATQYPITDNLDSTVRGQCQVKVCYRVERKAHTDVALGDGAAEKGYRPDEIDEDRKGSFYIRGPGNKDPELNRTYWMDDDLVESRTKMHARNITKIDAETMTAFEPYIQAVMGMAPPRQATENVGPAPTRAAVDDDDGIQDAEVVDDPNTGYHRNPHEERLREPVRMVLEAIRSGSHAAKEIQAHTGIPLANIYRHLAKLQEYDLVEKRGTKYYAT